MSDSIDENCISERRRLSTGAAFLHHTNSVRWGPLIVAVMRLNSRPSTEALLRDINRIAEQNIKLRSTVELDSRTGHPHWHAIPNFDVRSYILKEVECPGEDSDAERITLVSNTMDEYFPDNHPQWSVTMVTYVLVPDTVDLLFKLSHSLGDGTSLFDMLMSVTETNAVEPDAPQLLPSSVKNRRATSMAAAAGRKLMNIYFGIHGFLKVLTIPSRPGDRRTSLTVQEKDYDAPKIAAVRSIPLMRLKRCQSPNCTVNDVIMSCVTGALRRYMISRGDLIMQTRNPKITAVAMVGAPRAPNPNQDIAGVAFSSLFVPVKLKRKEPLAQLIETHKVLDRMKRSGEAYFTVAINSFLYRKLPFRTFTSLVTTAVGKATCCVSNLKGPSGRITFANAGVTSIFNLVNPQMAFNLSILSYNGEVMLTVAANSVAMPLPSLFLDMFMEEVNQLEAAVQGSPEILKKNN